MIQTNELRIGNYLQDSISKELLKVIGINENGLSTYVVDRSKFPLSSNWEAEPIPLTEEWLIEWGFKYDEDFDTWANENMKILLRHDGISVTDLPYVCDLKYVHQFQNLYFVLNNQELCRK